MTTVGAPQPLPIHSVFQEGEFVPIRAKIQTNELSYNGTILLNREDLLRAISVLNFQYGGVQERSALCVCWLTCVGRKMEKDRTATTGVIMIA